MSINRLALSGFKQVLGDLEPMLKGTPAEFQGAISAIFEAMAGPLAGAERWRVDHLREAEQSVVLGVWDLLFSSTVEQLDAVVDQLAGAISVPYLSLHGIDPGPDYAEWLGSRVSTATVELWPDMGHYPHLVEPATIPRPGRELRLGNRLDQRVWSTDRSQHGLPGKVDLGRRECDGVERVGPRCE